MNLIVNVDSNWAIGHQGKLLVTIPEDMKFFRSETSGKVVVLLFFLYSDGNIFNLRSCLIILHQKVRGCELIEILYLRI